MSKYIMCNECEMCDGDRCTYFDNDSDRESTLACILFEPKNPTLFDRITQSPEVLAENFVEDTMDGTMFYSILTRWDYSTKERALAATVAKLKEVAE